MKEQDLIHMIDEETKNIPIPDSISPDAMKKMLDEHIAGNENESALPKETDETNAGAMKKNNRRIRRYTIAACAALCLFGTIGVTRLIGNPLSDQSAKSGQSEMQMESAENGAEMNAADESGMDVAAEESAIATSGSDEEDLARQSNLLSPASYEDYYDTMKSAYDAYYDRLATVTTDYDDIVTGETTVNQSAARGYGAVKESVQSDSDTNASADFSTTNTQEENVDEGDIIKTDGKYIYKIISGYDERIGYNVNKLTITQAENGNLTFVTSIDLDEVIKKEESNHIRFEDFYLYDDQLVFIYSKQNYIDWTVEDDSMYEEDTMSDDSMSTYIVLFNLKDKAHPLHTKTLKQSGWYETSRISDGYLYTISNFCEISFNDRKDYKNYIPFVDGNPISCIDIYYPAEILAESTHVITSLDLSHPKDFTDTKAISSNGNEYYVSDSAIYIYATKYNEIQQTEIMRVDYKDGILTVGNSAVITGYLYDTFALNEYNGYLRIVATIPANTASNMAIEDFNNDFGKTGDDLKVTEDINVIYILDSHMKLTGKLSGIAPGERIYSARFFGDTGYFVTYRNMDPLFSVDLSDPSNPTIIDSLKIPGFSNYLHFYANEKLLGIGQEINPKTQEFLGLKLSMFDISDPGNVTEEDKYIIKDSEYSEVLYNHKAILIDPEKNIFGFLYYGPAPGADEYDCFYRYIYATYTYDAEKGFIETASYPISEDRYMVDSIRGLYIGDYFYLATNRTITSYRIGEEKEIAQVEFP